MNTSILVCFSEAFCLPVTTLIPTAWHFLMPDTFPRTWKLFLESHKLKSATTQWSAIEHSDTTKALCFLECVSVLCLLFTQSCGLPNAILGSTDTQTFGQDTFLGKPTVWRRKSLSLIATGFGLCPYIPTLCCRSKNRGGRAKGLVPNSSHNKAKLVSALFKWPR